MGALGLKQADLKVLPLGCREKVALAWGLRQGTIASVRRVAQGLTMGYYPGVIQVASRSIASLPKTLDDLAGTCSEKWNMHENTKCHNHRTDLCSEACHTAGFGSRRAAVSRTLRLLGIILGLALLWSTLDYLSAVRRYPLGISLAEAQMRMGRAYAVREGGPVSLNGELPEDAKRFYTFYDVIVVDQGVVLEFNYYRELTGRRWLGPPPLRIFEKAWRDLFDVGGG